MVTSARLRHLADQPRWLVWGYLLLIAAAELLIALVSPRLGFTVHALLLIGLIVHGAVGRAGAEQRLVLGLTLAPLIRILSLALPLTSFPQLAWYPIVASLLMVAAWTVIRQLHLSRWDLGLCPGHLWLQLMLAGGGLGLGTIEYSILAPRPLIATFSWETFLLAALILLVFTGFAEELIFRGLLQPLALSALGRWGLVYVALLFAVLHIGYLSMIDVVFVLAVGLLFGYIVYLSGSILGVTLVHGLINVMLFLIMPYLAQQPSAAVATMATWVIWIGTAIGAIAASVLIARARPLVQAGSPVLVPANSAPASQHTEGAPQADPKSSHAERPADETSHQAASDDLGQAIERTSAKYIADLRVLGEELRRRSVPSERAPGAPADHVGGSNPQSEAIHERSDRSGVDRVGPVDTAAPLEPAQDPIEQGRGRVLLWLQSASQHIGPKLASIEAHFPSRLLLSIVLGCAAVLIGIGIVLLVDPRPSIGNIAPTAQPIRATAQTAGLNEAHNDSSLPAPTAAALESAPTVLAPTLSPASTAVARLQAGGETRSQTSEALPHTAIDASPLPSAEPPSARDVLHRIAAAEATLQTGQFEATIDYGNGNRSSARVRFDLGNQQRVPRFQITSMYTGTAGIQTTERITIGDQSWQRELDGDWSARPASEAVLDQVRVFLPHADSIANPEGDGSLQPAVLSWYDAGGDVDVTVVADRASGVPRELRQVARTTNTVLTVTYFAWNTPVEITPP
jgi:membrane protease YdiL (CAAX protease family)